MRRMFLVDFLLLFIRQRQETASVVSLISALYEYRHCQRSYGHERKARSRLFREFFFKEDI